MNLRGILVLLGDDAPSAAREHLASRLAVAHDAHLTGIAPTGRPEIEGTASASHAIEVADHARDDAWSHADALARRFRDAARAEGVVSVDAEAAEGAALPLLMHHAACHDLVVVSPPPAASPGWRGGVHFVEQVLAHSPRPTLVVPGTGRFDHAGRNIVIAWDDSPAAVRATTDALPMLRTAERVLLCVWRRASEAADHGIAMRLAEVCQWLKRHGVVADTRVSRAAGAIGDTMLADATRLGADLIVMGTYGHARWIERVTGGVTRTALLHAPVPLWMSR